MGLSVRVIYMSHVIWDLGSQWHPHESCHMGFKVTAISTWVMSFGNEGHSDMSHSIWECSFHRIITSGWHCAMTHSHMTWLIPTWCDSFLYDMHRIITSGWHCAMTHSHMTWLIPTWHDSFLYDMHRVITSGWHCAMTHSLTWLIPTHMTWRIPTWHDSFLYDMHRIITSGRHCDMIHFPYDMTHSHVARPIPMDGIVI